jgi:hypothetical protein
MRLLQQDARTRAVRAGIGLRAFGAAAVAALVAACADRTAPVAPLPAAPLSASAVAQVQTTPALTWLAPLGAGSSTPATFDAQAAPVVEVCAWTGSACSGGLVARFSTAPTGTDLPLTVNAAAGAYEANWNLMDTRFTTRRTYRIRVLQGTTERGAMSVDVVRGRWALTRSDGALVPLMAASALPIRFGVSAQPPATVVRQVIDAGGGTVEMPGAGGILLPSGGVTAPTPVTVERELSPVFDAVVGPEGSQLGVRNVGAQRLRVSMPVQPSGAVGLYFAEADAVTAGHVPVVLVRVRHGVPDADAYDGRCGCAPLPAPTAPATRS